MSGAFAIKVGDGIADRGFEVADVAGGEMREVGGV
jgi:hypothetical protein